MHDSRSDFVSGTMFSIQLWTARRQKSYVFGDLKLFTFMPACAVENRNAVVSRLYGSAGEMFVRRVGPVAADREHSLCACGSEKVDAAGGRKRPAGGCSCAPTAATAFPPALVLEPGRSPGFVGPCRIFHNVLKIPTEFLLGLCLKRTRRNVTEAQPPPDGSLPYLTPKFVWILFFMS